jgi:hypothetical protein
MVKSMNEPLDPHDFIASIEGHWLPNAGKDWDNFSLRGYSTANHIEWDAIKHLAEDLPHLQSRPNAADEAGFEAWRALWVNEALHMRKHLHPGSAKFAAAEVLVLGSSLRAAIARGEAERAAALGALIMCYAIAGGYSPKMEAIVAAGEAIRKAKAVAFKNGAGRAAEDMGKAREACVRWAADLWRKDPSLRIGLVADKLLEHLRHHKAKLPNLDSFPKVATVKAWLREASAAGTLTIPEAAQRRGRPRG